jgi:hypothetical protein
MTENTIKLLETKDGIVERQNVSVHALITGVVATTVVHNLIPKNIAAFKAGESKTFVSGLLEGATRLRAWGAPAAGIAAGLFVNSVTRSPAKAKRHD